MPLDTSCPGLALSKAQKGFIKKARQPCNRLDVQLSVRTAELLNQDTTVAISQHRLGTARFAFPKRRDQRPEFGFVVAALDGRRLR